MRLLVCGSRQWHDRPAIRAVLRERRAEALEAGEEFVVIHGACPDGADLIADQICVDELGMTPGIDLIREPAQWNRYGRAAGPIRNQKMLDDHEPTLVVAFRYGSRSSGTDDMIRRGKRVLGEEFVQTHAHPVSTP